MLEARVKAGAELLDRRHPGWWRQIDQRLLDMSLCTRCVLGQVTGSYYTGLDQLFGDGRWGRPRAAAGKWAVEHGFALDSDSDARWKELESLWLAEIEARRDTPRGWDHVEA